MAHPFDEFRGARVLVTGASTGIGAAVARAFGARGARVAVHGHANLQAAAAVAAGIDAAGGQGVVVAADLARPEGGAEAVAAAAAALGGLDILINNAGSILGRMPTAEVPPERLRALIDLNLTSVFTACQAAIPLFRAGGRGCIVNTSSLAARMGGGPGTVGYAAAKAGVSTLTRGLARELGPERIRVNAVAPGFIRTPLHDRHTDPAILEGFAAQVPLGRLGEPGDCTGAYLFLACEALAGYITGQTIEVNGGLLMP